MKLGKAGSPRGSPKNPEGSTCADPQASQKTPQSLKVSEEASGWEPPRKLRPGACGLHVARFGSPVLLRRSAGRLDASGGARPAQRLWRWARSVSPRSAPQSWARALGFEQLARRPWGHHERVYLLSPGVCGGLLGTAYKNSGNHPELLPKNAKICLDRPFSAQIVSWQNYLTESNVALWQFQSNKLHFGNCQQAGQINWALNIGGLKACCRG